MKRGVFFTTSAKADVMDILHHFAMNQDVETALELGERLESAASSLMSLPGRGHHPPELERLGVLDCREIHCRQFRIVYQLDDENVYVIAVMDARRDVEDILINRMIR